MLAVCKTDDGQPTTGGLKKLDSKLIDEISTDYNLLADCLDLDGRFYFPKITGESGFQINTLGPKGDGGIGQLTGTAIDDVNSVLPNYIYRIKKSDNKSCQALAKLIRTKLADKVQVSSDYSNRCALINDHANPLRNLIYTMVLNDKNRRSVNTTYESQNIRGQMMAVGVVLTQEEEDRLKSLLAMMGYNMGGANAVKDLSSYLQARADFIGRKAQELPGLMFQPQFFASVLPNIHDFLKMVDPSDVDMVAGLDRYKELLKPHLDELKAKYKTDDDRAKKEYEVWLRNISASELSFSEWLWVWQKSRGVAYVNMINNIRKRMDDQMGVGVCTSDHMNRD